MAFSGLAPTGILLCQEPRAGHSAPGRVLWEGVEGQKHLPQTAGPISFNAAQDIFGFLGCRCTLLHHLNFSSTDIPRPSQGCSQSILFPACVSAWDCLNYCAGPYKSNFRRFAQAHLSSLSWLVVVTSLQHVVCPAVWCCLLKDKWCLKFFWPIWNVSHSTGFQWLYNLFGSEERLTFNCFL